MTCTKCGQEKTESEFYVFSLLYGSKHCRECHRARVRKFQRANRARLTAADTARRRLREYGITTDQFVVMLASQEFQCAICSESLIHRKTAVDHNHQTGKVRGLLCDRCNRGIGLLKDDPNVLAKAARYVVAV